MKRRTFYTELAYILGLIVLAFSAALMEASDLGVSMIVAPAYLLHLKLSQTFAFFTFGMAEYTLQAALLIVMVMVLGRFRLYYLFSFITAVLYGLLLDGSMAIVALLGVSGMAGRITCFTAGGNMLCGGRIAAVPYIYRAGGIRAVCEGDCGQIRAEHKPRKDRV